MMLTLLLVLVTPSLEQTTVSPAVSTSIPGGSTTFTCSASTLGDGDSIIGIQWQLNNTPLVILGLDNVADVFLPQTSTGLLTFSSISQDLNMTNVTCLANLTSGHVVISERTAILLVQGLLSDVGNLSIMASNSTLSLTWEPPFTLDIDAVPDDDITGYCMDVINSTSSVTLLSQCGITETTFTFPIPPDTICHVYNFTVTPVNIVGNGTEDTTSYIGVQASPEVLSYSDDECRFVFLMSDPVCDAKLTLLDLNTGENISIGASDLTLTDDSITFSAAQLTTNRHYNVSIRASNAAGTSTSVHQISTHAIKGFTVTEDGGKISSMITYGCDAILGALFNFIFFTDTGTVDFTKSQLVPLDRNSSVLPIQLEPGRYQVHVYDIEQDGTLVNGTNYPAVSHVPMTKIEGTIQKDLSVQTSFGDHCNISGSFHQINVVCTYSANSMATGFLVIMQQNSLNEVHKLYTNQTTHQQNTVSIEVEKNGLYLVSVIPILEGTGITNSRVEYKDVIKLEDLHATETPTRPGSVNVSVITSAVSFVLVVLVAVVVFIVVAKNCKPQKVTPDNEKNNHDQAAQVEPNLDNKEDPDESAGTETVDENQNYAFVEPIKRGMSDGVDLHEVAKDFDRVVYSDIVQQKPKVNFESLKAKTGASAC